MRASALLGRFCGPSVSFPQGGFGSGYPGLQGQATLLQKNARVSNTKLGRSYKSWRLWLCYMERHRLKCSGARCVEYRPQHGAKLASPCSEVVSRPWILEAVGELRAFGAG